MPGPVPGEAASLARTLGLPPVAGQLLTARGFSTPDEVEAFLDPSPGRLHRPDSLPDISVATERVITAVKRNEVICIHGDYDADGVTATAFRTMASLA